MKLPYLGNAEWSSITREERYFCAELFHAIRGREAEFVAWLGELPGMRSVELDAGRSWEVGFEVCFYRDLLKSVGKPIKPAPFPQKRTFDLCLFSPADVVIIEAKAQQAFKAKDLAEFENDKRDVPAVIAAAGRDSSSVRVTVLGLAASRFFESVVKYGGGIPGVFDGWFSWKEVDRGFHRHRAFSRAEAVYKS
jgi:hypothetical protein